jgi:hypothetical protein
MTTPQFDKDEFISSIKIIKNSIVNTSIKTYTLFNCSDFLNNYLKDFVKLDYSKKLGEIIRYKNREKKYLKYQRDFDKFILDKSIHIEYKILKIVSKFLRDIFNENSFESYIKNNILSKLFEKNTNCVNDEYCLTLLKIYDSVFKSDVELKRKAKILSLGLNGLFFRLRKRTELSEFLIETEPETYVVELKTIRGTDNKIPFWKGNITINLYKFITKLVKFLKSEIKKETNTTSELIYERLIKKFIDEKLDCNSDIFIKFSDIKRVDKRIIFGLLLNEISSGKTYFQLFDKNKIKIYDLDNLFTILLELNNDTIQNIYINYSHMNKNCSITINGLHKMLFENITMERCIKIKRLMDNLGKFSSQPPRI